MNRRKFLKQSLTLAGITTVGLGIGGYQGFVEMGGLVIEQHQVPLTNLHPAVEGFKIAVLSDFHLYPYVTVELIQHAVSLTNALNPDLVVLLGDFVWRQSEAVYDLIPVLLNLNATYGVFAIMGNHDLRHDKGKIVRPTFLKSPLPVLQNKGFAFDVGQGQLYLAGLDDGLLGQPNIEVAMANLSSNVPSILLMHEPDYIDTYAGNYPVSLQLSGHTHGGQIRFPGIGATVLPPLGRRYEQGLYKVQETWLYVNRGLGSTLIPMRWNCRPEITELTLISA